jgi:hypothetical protein
MNARNTNGITRLNWGMLCKGNSRKRETPPRQGVASSN